MEIKKNNRNICLKIKEPTRHIKKRELEQYV